MGKITDAITNKSLKKVTRENLINYEHEDYRNIFLFAIRKGVSVEFFNKILEKTKLDEDGFENKIRETDRFGRDALSLAVLSNNSKELMRFLLEKHSFTMKKSGGDALEWSIKRKNPEAFFLLSKNEGYMKKIFLMFVEFVNLENLNAIKFILKRIDESSTKKQKLFFRTKDEHERNVFSIVSRSENDHIIDILLSFDWDEKIKIDYENKDCVYLFKRMLKNNQFMGDFDLIEFSKKLAPAAPNRRGAVANFYKEEKRSLRSFEGERTRQLLKQVATQLYFFFDKKVENLVEVQLMYLSYGKNRFLFLTANPCVLSKELLKHLNFKNIEEKLTKKFNPTDKKGQLRSERYSKKLKDRVFEEETNLSFKQEADKGSADYKRAFRVARILRKKEILPLSLTMQDDQLSEQTKATLEFYLHLPKEQTEKIFFVIPEIYKMNLTEYKKKYDKKHAEEFL